MSEIILDTQFLTLGNPDSVWTVQCHHGVSAAATIHNSVLSLAISKTRGANWHAELRNAPIPVQPGDKLQLTFSARADNPFTFSVWLGQLNAPYQSLVSPENHFGEKLMTTEWQTFSHTWHPMLIEKEARLNFVLGPIDNVVEIKNVSLMRT